MPVEDPIQMNSDFAHEGENVADSAPSALVPDPSPAASSAAPGPMSARDDNALTTLHRQREALARQARAGDRAALRRYLQLRRR